MATFSHGHDWGWRMMACSRCGVQLTDYERGEPYQCGATPEPPLWAPQVHQSAISDVHRKALVEGMGTLFVGPDGEATSVDPHNGTPEPTDWRENSKGALVTPAPDGGFFVTISFTARMGGET